MTVFKHIIMMAHNEGLIRVNPFASYTNSYTGVDRGYLSEGDLLRLMEVPTCSAVEVQVRDIFLFSAFTGLSYVDVKNLRSNHLQKHFDGHYWVITRRQKTGVLSSIRLLDVPLRLTDKYRDTLPDGRLFPVPSNNCCNENLKKMARRAGIGVHLTFHVARHTFAMLALNRGMPIETLSQILGHKNIRTTQIYAKISNRKISEEIALLEDNLSDFETHISLKI